MSGGYFNFDHIWPLPYCLRGNGFVYTSVTLFVFYACVCVFHVISLYRYVRSSAIALHILRLEKNEKETMVLRATTSNCRIWWCRRKICEYVWNEEEVLTRSFPTRVAQSWFAFLRHYIEIYSVSLVLWRINVCVYII